eukprot:TRINITY_DN12791_c0_g1_i1.p1 TRINITY_DN12791_c0_g1~~TRINITY_DN12791_c0_g1_i1.p1  ORF type:complete len:309 (+),score=34.21 TRINITY_DN12791_c0_g1_i1:73-999(+)
MSNLSYYACPPDDFNCTTCVLRYTGENCDIDVLDNSVFSLALTIYTIIFALIWLIATVTLCFLIYKNIFGLNKNPKLIAFWPGYLLVPSLLIRFVYFIDPNGIRMIFSSSFLVIVLVYLPGVFIFGSAVLTVSVWLDVLVGIGKKYQVETNFTTPKIISAAFVFMILVALLLLLILFHEDPSNLALFGNILIALCGIILLVFVIGYLPVVHSKFSGSQLKRSVRKIENSLVASCVVFVVGAVFMVGLSVLRVAVSTNEIRFIIYYLLLQGGVRIVEMGIMCCVIYSTLTVPADSSASVSYSKKSPHTK